MQDAPLSGRRAFWAWNVAIGLGGLFIAAGGLGMASACALGGLIAFPRPAIWRGVAPAWSSPRDLRTVALGAGLCFLLWAGIAQIWAPGDAGQLARLWSGVVLYAALLLATARLPDGLRDTPRRLTVIFVILAALLLTEEAATGGAIATLVEGVERYDLRTMGTLGRGAAALLIMAGPAAAMALVLGGRWRYALLLLLGPALVAAFGFGIVANRVVIAGAAAAFLIAWRWPRGAVLGFGFITAAWLLAFPLLIALIEPVAEAIRAALPFSWEWRWEAWRHAAELIAQKPLLGWGMDASRHFNDDLTVMRGFEVRRIPLHTHSAAMQIWLETGLVGAVLSAAAVLSGAVLAARAPGLTRLQACAAVSAAVATLLSLAISYGVWQEWIWGTAFMAAAGCFLTGAAPQERNR